MAKSRRPRRFSSRRRVAADWVYRPNLIDLAGALIDDLGSYDHAGGTLVGGPTNANFHILYDSHNYLVQTKGPTLAGVGGQALPMAARAEATRPLIMRVQGTMLFKPSAWAVGSIFQLAWRFGIFEQDPQSGSILIDPSYSLWNSGNAGINQLRPATWANDRNWQHERRYGQAFHDNGAYFMQRFNFRVNRRIDPNECYGLFLESDIFFVSSVNLLYQLWFRTLVADEG